MASPSATPEAAVAPSPAAAPAAPTPEAPGPCCVIPAGALVVVELTAPLSASTAKAGDHFAIRLAEPIVIQGQVVVPAGVTGVGEVIDAKPANLGGRPGRLVLAARYLESGALRLDLQSLKLGGGGHDNSGLAVGAMIAVGVVGALVTGGGLDYAAGTRATAKIAHQVSVAPVVAAATPSPVSAP